MPGSLERRVGRRHGFLNRTSARNPSIAFPAFLSSMGVPLLTTGQPGDEGLVASSTDRQDSPPCKPGHLRANRPEGRMPPLLASLARRPRHSVGSEAGEPPGPCRPSNATPCRDQAARPLCRQRRNAVQWHGRLSCPRPREAVTTIRSPRSSLRLPGPPVHDGRPPC
jgi:hypothetical protein